MEPFKNIFNKDSVNLIATQIQKAAKKNFKKEPFLKAVLPRLSKLELKDRVRLISDELNSSLTLSYKKNIDILIKSLAEEGEETGITGFLAWPLLQYVEDYGREDFETSFKAMYEMTKRFSAEFAIRPFLIADDKKVFKILEKWKKDKNHHIRRLCSEGIRPHLPWGMKVPSIHNDLKRNIKFIESLRNDPEEYVRRSVANHLNDISHLDEKLMLDTVCDWNKGKPNDDLKWLIRHSTRTLLKKGHPRALKLHGYNPKIKLSINKLKLSKKKIKEGDSIDFSFEVKNNSKKKEKVLMDYIIHYLKKDGSYSKKAFRFKDSYLAPNTSEPLLKTIKFKKVTTRVHYPGVHKISLLINGQEFGELLFKLSV